MKVIGLEALIKFSHKHANAKAAIDAWRLVVDSATWRTPHDIKAHFRSVDFLPGNRAIFNIKGNHYRLLVTIHYQTSWVTIDWVGTHADYDKHSFR